MSELPYGPLLEDQERFCVCCQREGLECCEAFGECCDCNDPGCADCAAAHEVRARLAELGVPAAQTGTYLEALEIAGDTGRLKDVTAGQLPRLVNNGVTAP
jgi:hypothetical protein